MKKTFFLIIALSAALSSCEGNRKETKNPEKVKVEKLNNTKKTNKVKVVKVDNTKKTVKVFREFKTLYTQLLKFKNKSDFKTYGFGQASPYNTWITDVQALMNNPDSDLLHQKGIVAGDLKALGLAYASSKGRETEVTKNFNKFFSDAISKKTVAISGNSNYNKIKADFEFFGKWEISNSTMNTSYAYEIYKKGSEFIGITLKGDFKTETLVKKGNKYMVKGDKYGQYYIINSNREMTLFDKQGELASMGYKATKK